MKSATFAQSFPSAPFLLLLLHLIVEFHDLRTHILSTRSHTSYWRLPSHTRDGQVKKSHARGTKHNTKLISRVQFVKMNSIFLFFLLVDEDFVEKLSLKLYKRRRTFVIQFQKIKVSARYMKYTKFGMCVGFLEEWNLNDCISGSTMLAETDVRTNDASELQIIQIIMAYTGVWEKRNGLYIHTRTQIYTYEKCARMRYTKGLETYLQIY